MGGNTISFLDAEKKTWVEHNIVYDSSQRELDLQNLAQFVDGASIKVGWSDCSYEGISFSHYFVTDGVTFLEFGGSNLSIYDARVNINRQPRPNRKINYDKQKPMCEEVRVRMRHVIGMKNYSLCLRNCEHVANYVYSGMWISSQLDLTGVLMKLFKHHLLGENLSKVNSFPSNLRVVQNVITQYSFIRESIFSFNSVEYYLDKNDNATYNIVVIGASGHGKSRLINALINSTICESRAGHSSVTKDVYFIRGKGEFVVTNGNKQLKQQREVVIADTIGLCDTELNHSTVFNCIKGRIHSSWKEVHCVVVVFEGRLIEPITSYLRQVLEWLKFSSSPYRFLFVSTKAQGLSTDARLLMKNEAITLLGLNQRNVDTSKLRIVYVDFPVESNRLSDLSKDDIKTCYDQLKTQFGSIDEGLPAIDLTHCCSFLN